MKHKKLIQRGYVIIGVILLILFSIFLGGMIEQMRRQKALKEQTTNLIAVVNTDIGIIREGERINYASKLIQFPDTNFSYAGLEEARSGIEEERYAAYIIIPENFSSCVASVDAEPEKIKVEYAMNANLREDVNSSTLKDIHTFEILLNTNLSYMYVSAILSEFNHAQDQATTIMTNDNEELKLIEGIEKEALLAQLEQPEAELPEREWEMLNLSEHMEENSLYLEEYNTYQTEAMLKGQEDFLLIKEGSEALNGVMLGIVELYSGLDITTDDNGDIVYQAGMEELEEALKDYEEEALKERKDLRGALGWSLDDAGNEKVEAAPELLEALSNAMQILEEEYNDELESDMTEIFTLLEEATMEQDEKEEIQKKLDEIEGFSFDEEKVDKEAIITWQKGYIDQVMNLTMPDVTQWETILEDKVIGSIIAEALKENESIAAATGLVSEAMYEYELALMEFDPFQYIAYETIQEYLGKINENIFDMEDMVNERVMENEEYVGEVILAAGKQMQDTEEVLEITYTETGDNIGSMVEYLKESRRDVNQTNIDLLGDFTKQLNNLRLGKVEYTQMYDFVTHPVETNDVGGGEKSNYTGESYQEAVQLLAVFMVLWLLGLGSLSIKSVIKDVGAYEE